MERIIAERLMEHVDAQQQLRDYQYGFRSGRGIEDAVIRLKETVRNSEAKYVIALFIDIKGAFDAVWWPTILQKLKDMNFSRNMFDTVNSYLADRTVELTNDGETVRRNMNKGCPQGSVLGPAFWNLTFDNLLTKDLAEGRSPIAFADDVAFTIEGNSRVELERKAKHVCETIQNWAKDAKMEVAADKTKDMIFKKRLNGRPPVIKLNNRSIQFVNQITYLGFRLDNQKLN